MPNTNILRLSVTWDVAGTPKRLAQRIAELFISENVQLQQSQSGTPQRADQLQESARQMQTRLVTLQQQRDRLDETVARGDLTKLPELKQLDTRLAALDELHQRADRDQSGAQQPGRGNHLDNARARASRSAPFRWRRRSFSEP